MYWVGIYVNSLVDPPCASIQISIKIQFFLPIFLHINEVDACIIYHATCKDAIQCRPWAPPTPILLSSWFKIYLSFWNLSQNSCILFNKRQYYKSNWYFEYIYNCTSWYQNILPGGSEVVTTHVRFTKVPEEKYISGDPKISVLGPKHRFSSPGTRRRNIYQGTPRSRC